MKQYRHAIVIGASSGIGAELVRQLAADGCKVAAVARRADRLETLASENPGLILPIVHDVTHPESAPALFQEITQKLGGLDLFVYAAGVMPDVSPTEYDFVKDRAMIDTNVTGAVAWLNLASERFQGTHSGTIVGIGSVAGDRGRRKQLVYNASKAFLHTYLEGLRNRLSRHGVTVVTVKPGPTKTDMTAGLKMKGMMPVDVAARRILTASQSGGEKYLSTKHRVAFYIVKRIPSWIFRRLNL